MSKENKIKHYLLPYQSILKLSDMGGINDDEPLQPDPIEPETFIWGSMDASCSYPTYLTKTIGNIAVTETFTKNNCGNGYDGTEVPYTVAANTYFGFTLAEANLLALKQVREQGQAYANANGSCTLSPYGWRVKEDTAYCVQDNASVTQDIILRWGAGVASFKVEIYQFNPGSPPQLIETFNKTQVPATTTEKRFVFGSGTNYGISVTMSVSPTNYYANVTTVNSPALYATRGSVFVPETSIQTNGNGETIVMSSSQNQSITT